MHKTTNMKRHFFLSILFFCFLQLKAQPQEHTLQFSLTFNGETLEMGKNYYLPSIKDSIEFEAFRFYISDLQFATKEEVLTSIEKKYWLIDAENSESLKEIFTTDFSSKTTFKKLQFKLGIDSTTNVSGAFGGDLDPTNGMYWTWQSGYINFKLEGISKVCPSRKNRFQFHIGGYQSPFNTLQKVELETSDTNDIEVNIAIDQLLSQVNLAENYQIMQPNQEAIEMAKLISSIFTITK